MKVRKICNQSKVRKNLSQTEWETMVAQFNRAAKPLAVITDLLEQRIVAIDNSLADDTLYDKPRADLFMASQLAKKAVLMDLHKLLNETTTIDTDQVEK